MESDLPVQHSPGVRVEEEAHFEEAAEVRQSYVAEDVEVLKLRKSSALAEAAVEMGVQVEERVHAPRP